MNIQLCTLDDVAQIETLYADARAMQAKRKVIIWPHFTSAFIAEEITKGMQWKLIIDNTIACNWSVHLADAAIWEEKEKGDAIYIHRLATNAYFRGNNLVQHMVDWAKQYAKALDKKFVRLDTLGNNTKLIELYTSVGFEFLGIFRLHNTADLPLHYQQEPDCCLFEIAL